MEALNRVLLDQDWITYLLGFLLFLVFLMKVYNSKSLVGYCFSFLTTGFFEKKSEDQEGYFSFFYILFFVFSGLVYSLLLYYLLNHFSEKPEFYFSYFLKVTAVVFGYYLLKFFLEFLLVRLFGIRDFTYYYRISKNGYVLTISLWLFPLLILNAYTFSSIYFLGLFFLLFLSIRAILITVNNKKLIASNFLYFILYLCALEIAPLFIMYKLLQ